MIVLLSVIAVLFNEDKLENAKRCSCEIATYGTHSNISGAHALTALPQKPQGAIN